MKSKGFFFERHDQSEDVLLLREILNFLQMIQRRLVLTLFTESQRRTMDTVESNAIHIVLTAMTSNERDSSSVRGRGTLT